jgi:arylsulfatase A-like enzyme
MLVYRQHHAAGTFTSSGTASLLTGVYPWTHRALHLRSQTLPRFADSNLFSRLPSQYYKFALTHNPLAFALLQQAEAHIDDLDRLGDLALYANTFTEAAFYQDYYVASTAEDLLLKEEYDPSASLFLSLLDRLGRLRANSRLNAQHRPEYPRGLVNCRTANPGVFCFTLEEAIDRTLARVQAAPEPFCGYVHVFPPHAPYNPRAEFIRLFDDEFQPPDKPEFESEATHTVKSLARMRRFYDQSIAHVDAEIGRMVTALEAAGKLDNTVLVLTSDHGEMFERGIWGHISSTLYAPLVHIPLAVMLPGRTARRDVRAPTSAVDLLPSLLHLAGAPTSETEGVLLPGIAPGARRTDRSVFAMDAKTNPKVGPLQKASFAVLRWPFKLIHYRGYPSISTGFELYDLSTDPQELKNLYSPDHPQARLLREELEDQIAQNG